MNEIIVTAKEFDEEEKILTLDRRVVDRGLLGSYDKVRCRIGGELYYLKYDQFQGGPSGFYVDDRASVAEAFASAIAEHSDIKERMRCANYKLVKVRVDGREYSATISKPYLFFEEGEREMFLSTNYSTNCLLSKADYLNIIGWKRRGEKIVDAYAAKMPREEAYDYVRNLSAFDILTLNSDRVGNGYNCSIAHKGDRIIPINMDFGKCFGIRGYTKTMEEKLNTIFDEEELRELFGGIRILPGNSFFSLKELVDSGFVPFRFREWEMHAAFNEICYIAEGTDFEIYAEYLSESISVYLEKLKDILWVPEN